MPRTSDAYRAFEIVLKFHEEWVSKAISLASTVDDLERIRSIHRKTMRAIMRWGMDGATFEGV